MSRIKLILIGESKVGKTAIITQYIKKFSRRIYGNIFSR